MAATVPCPPRSADDQADGRKARVLEVKLMRFTSISNIVDILNSK
jgi:hypothetical protein